MPTIRCAACGKHYDYRQEGCCPRCGAYNRPPRREWVEADGSVHHGTPSEKVCYEKKGLLRGADPQAPEKALRPTGGKRRPKAIPGPLFQGQPPK